MSKNINGEELITLYLVCHAPHLRCQWFIGNFSNFELRIMNF